MSVANEITRISTAKDDIKKSMERLGYTVPSATKIDGYAEILDPRREGQTLSYISNPGSYLRFKFIENGSLYFKTTSPDFVRTIEYLVVDGVNSSDWVSFTSTIDGFICSVEAGTEILIKGDNDSGYGSATHCCQFYNTGFAYISGNMKNLLSSATEKTGSIPAYCFKELFQGCTELDIDIDAGGLTFPSIITNSALGTQCFYRMFYGCSSLTTTPTLSYTSLGTYCYAYMFGGTSITSAPTLPATILKNYCYASMFIDCGKLKQAPILSATTMTEGCYQGMFYNCTSLESAPTLSSTSLASYCYDQMFYHCVSLKQAPTLSATTMKSYCYRYMFGNCIGLLKAPELPAETLAAYCYQYMFQSCISLREAPALPATTLQNYCYSYMFQYCTNLIVPPALPATTMKTQCYCYMFRGCNKLQYAPDLNATTLVSNCYSYMFNGCTSLKYVMALFTTTPSTSYTNSWLASVASTGTFIKSPKATWTTTGTSAVPTGWTIGDYSDIPLTIESFADSNSIYFYTTSNDFRKTILISTDNGLTWTEKISSFKGTVCAILDAGQKLLIKGIDSQAYSDEGKNNAFFGSGGNFKVYGNIISLFGGTFNNNNIITCDYAFAGLFKNCKGLKDVENLILPATTLSRKCYYEMFKSTSIGKSPILPNATLAAGCYEEMFAECPDLTVIECLVEERMTGDYTRNWVFKVSETGTFICSRDSGWESGDSGIPANWTISYV